MVALGEALVVLGVVAVVVYVTYTALTNAGQRPEEAAPVVGGRWAPAHYASGGATRVVVRRTAPGTGRLLDEHVVAVIPDDDPDYDGRFLEAMALARSRAALFESES